jgi:hypothetical protein
MKKKGTGGEYSYFGHQFLFLFKMGRFSATFCADFEYRIYIALKLKLDENVRPILSSKYLKIGIFVQCFKVNKPRGCMDFS